MRLNNRKTLADLPLFSGLPDDLVERLTGLSSVQRYAPGTMLFHEGETAEHIHVLIKGIVELSRMKGRREFGVMMAATGDIFMPVAALFGEPYLTSARVLTSSSLLLLETAVVREEAMRNPQLAMRIAQLVGGQWRMAVRHILDLKCRSAPERLGAFLLRLVDENDSSAPTELPIPKRHLASRVGMAPETLSRTLQLLAENGLHVRGNRILVRDRGKIDAFCGPDPYPERGEGELGVYPL